MTEPITGRVAALLNSRELVLNIGSKLGVERDMRFAVLNPSGLDITDPITDEPLGSISVPKIFVKIIRVEENLSVATTYRKRRVNRGGLGGLGSVAEAFAATRWTSEPETIRSTERTYQQEITEKESFIKIGDPVVQVIGDEFTDADDPIA